MSVGRLPRDGAEPVAGVNAFREIVAKPNKAFNALERYALTHGRDNQPQLHTDLHDGR